MKTYTKPAMEAVEIVTETGTMEGLSVVTSVSAQGAGLAKGERNWEDENSNFWGD